MTFMHVLAMLIFCHAVCDYPLQGDFLAKAKSRVSPIPGVDWWIAMSAHCVIHAGAVGIVTGSLALAAVEFVLHFIIDDQKCVGRTSFRVDQTLHVACKATYVVWLLAEGGGA